MGLGWFNSSKKSNETNSYASHLNLDAEDNEGNIDVANFANAIVDGGIQITRTDHGAVKTSLDAMTTTTDNAIDAMREATADTSEAARDIAQRALTNARAAQEQDSAETMKYLIVAGAVVAVVVGAIKLKKTG